MIPPPPSRLLLLPTDAASVKEELDEGGKADWWLLAVLEPVAFLRMWERLRFPASFPCFLPGLEVVASYEWSRYLLDEAWDKLAEDWAEEPLASAARKEAAGCAAFSRMEGSEGLLFDSRPLLDALAAAPLALAESYCGCTVGKEPRPGDVAIALGIADAE